MVCSGLRCVTISVGERMDSLTSLERLRLENIKRNDQVLHSLGLGGGKTLLGNATQHEAVQTARPSKKRKLPQVKRDDHVGGQYSVTYLLIQQKDVPILPARRSLRNIGRDMPDYKEAPDAQPYRTTQSKKGTWDEDDIGNYNGQQDEPFEPPPPRLASLPAPDSSRSLKADVSGFLRRFLGKKVPETGKQAVMDLLSGAGQRAKFSKYAGVVEWLNAVVLWVNVDGSDYDNLFLEGGQQMTWFGPSRATDETPVIQRLHAVGKDIGTGQKAASEGGDSEDEEATEILLLCRLTGEPYVFMGRVAHVRFDMRARPVKVLWRLKDYEHIRDSPDFRSVVRLDEEEGNKK